jgi:chromate transport protein ChrA
MSLSQYILRVVAISAMALGSGPVMIPLARDTFVGGRILTEQQLLFALTIGQIVPGQANLFVASIGYMLFGVGAAFLAILAINLPGYLMLPLVRCYQRLNEQPAVRNFVRGLTSASVGLIFASALGMAAHTLRDRVSWSAFLATLLAIQILRWRPVVSLALVSGAGMLLLACF